MMLDILAKRCHPITPSLLLLVNLDHLCPPVRIVELRQHLHDALLGLVPLEQLVILLLGVHELVLLSPSLHGHPVSRTDSKQLVQQRLLPISIDEEAD